MARVFLSYSRSDTSVVEALEAHLADRGIEVWRDKEDLYGGTRWPRALGQAIAERDAVVLVWSREAAASEYVELEWCTAIALGKPIVPSLLDATPLPPTLRALQGVPKDDPDALADAVGRLVGEGLGKDEAARKERVLAGLGTVPSGEPAEVLRAAKEVFDQRGWTVHGGVHITTAAAPAAPRKTLIERWQTWVALAVGLLTAASLALQLSERVQTAAEPEPQTAPAAQLLTQRLGGWIRDESGTPLAGVRVSLPVYDLSRETDELGRFEFEVEAEPERQVDLVAQKDGYLTYENFATVGNTRVSFTMKEGR